MLSVRLLGRFDVRLGGEPVDIPSRPSQSLLAYLLLHAAKRHRRERLSGLLWPDSDETNARSNLRHALWRVRKALGPAYITADKLEVAFNREQPYEADVERLADEGERQPSIKRLKVSVGAYGGELLPGFYENWVQLERQRLRVVFENKMQSLLDALIASQAWAEVIEWGERWIALGAAPEVAYRALMVGYCGLGDTARMAEVYRRCREVLRDELGLEPSPQTVKMYNQLSSSEGALAADAAKPISVLGTPQTGSAFRAILDLKRSSGEEVLDLPSLAILHAAQESPSLGEADLAIILRSVLHHRVEIEPWIEKLGRDARTVNALRALYGDYPRPAERMMIVEGLENATGDAAGEALIDIVRRDDSADVKTAAALAAGRAGMLRDAAGALLDQMRQKQDPSATAAFVALVDEMGLPEDIGNYPRFLTRLSLARRRWKAHRSDIRRWALRGALGAGLGLALHGSATPLYTLLAFPENLSEIQDVMSLPAWIFSGAVLGAVIGVFQGAASGFVLGLIDAVWRRKSRGLLRQALGSTAGLAHAFYLNLFSALELLRPVAGPAIYVPTNLVYGLCVGFALSFCVPPLGENPGLRKQVRRGLTGSAFLAALTVPYVFLIYQDQASVSLFSRLVYALLLPLGLALGFVSRRGIAGAQSFEAKSSH